MAGNQFLTSELMQLFKKLRRLCWPFWDLWFNLEFYLESVTKIRACHQRKCPSLKQHRVKAIRQKLCVVISLLAIRCVQLAVLSLVDLSPFTRMINHDYIMYINVSKEINLLYFMFGLQSICFTYRMYWFDFHRAFEPILVVRRVLFHSWNGCFLEHRVQHGQYRVAASQMVHSYTASYLNMSKYFNAIAVIVTVALNSYWARHLCDYWSYFLLYFPKGPLILAYGLCNLLFIDCFSMAFALVNIVWSTIIFTFTLCMFIGLKQANKMLQNSTLSSYSFGKFCSFHTEILTKIIAGNRYFGQMLLDYILIYVPISIYCFTEIILGRFGLMAIFIAINVLVFNYMVMFGFHLLAAMYSARIHKCRYWLLGWSARAQFGRRRLGTGLKLSHYICAFHTENQYGISYGNFGLISFDSFTKVIALAY